MTTFPKSPVAPVAAALLLALASCGGQTATVANLQSVKVDTVRTVGQQQTFQYPGRVKAAQDVSLAFRVSGTLQRICVEDGATVRQGQLLAQLDPTDYQVQLDATQAEYDQIKAEAERIMALYADNGVSANDNDKAVYGLRQITAKLQHHQDELAYTQLTAPFSGTVQSHLFEEHETVGAGMPVITMVGAGLPEVEISLPAADYTQRGRFDTFHCTFNVYPGQTYPLRLISISPKANANQLYTMRLQVQTEGRPAPAPGMNTMVTIACKADAAAPLAVAATAIVERDGQTCVFVYDPADGTAHLQAVDLIALMSDGTAMLSGASLRQGQVVVSSGTRYIDDGDRVQPLPTPSDSNVGGLL